MTPEAFDLARSVIRRAQWILDSPEYWVHGKTALDATGCACAYDAQVAVRWNGDGALCKAAKEVHPSSPAGAYGATCDLLSKIPEWPGEAGRPDYQEIIAFFRAALALTLEQT